MTSPFQSPSPERVAGRTLLARADAGPGIGFGHVARVEAILDAWAELGGRAVLLGRGVTGSFAARMAGSGVEVRPLYLPQGDTGETPEAIQPAGRADVDATLRAAADLGACAVLTDGYAFGRDYLAALAEAYPLASIDDLAAFDHPAHIVINSAVDFPTERYEIAPAARLLVGNDFIPLRREIRAAIAGAALPDAAGGEAVNRVVLTFGAADFGALTRPVCAGLLRALDASWRVTVVCGPAMESHEREGLESIAAADERVDLRVDVRSMADLVAGATLVVSAAGSTTWELLALGRAVVGFAVAENQRPIAEATHRRGAVAVPGFKPRAEEITTLALEVLGDASRRRSLAQKGRALVDGLGVWRIADAILDAADAQS